MFVRIDGTRTGQILAGSRNRAGDSGIHSNVHRKTERHLQLVAGGTTTTIIVNKSAFPSRFERYSSFVRQMPPLSAAFRPRRYPSITVSRLEFFLYIFPLVHLITSFFPILFASLDDDNERQWTATFAGITSASKVKPDR